MADKNDLIGCYVQIPSDMFSHIRFTLPKFSIPIDNNTRPTIDELLSSKGYSSNLVRVWWPGMAGTCDYIPGRMNVFCDVSGKITEINFG